MDRFDITGKADLGAGERLDLPRIRLMTRALLADRFKLVVHDETREMPIYALVLARKDGAFGSQLRRATADCAIAQNCGGLLGRGTMRFRGRNMEQLSAALQPQADRLVVDRTGLSGNFDADLQWTPDGPVPGALAAGGLPPPLDPDRPSLFTAVQEQLGLKLESATGPVNVLVIDHIERPTED